MPLLPRFDGMLQRLDERRLSVPAVTAVKRGQRFPAHRPDMIEGVLHTRPRDHVAPRRHGTAFRVDDLK